MNQFPATLPADVEVTEGVVRAYARERGLSRGSAWTELQDLLHQARYLGPSEDGARGRYRFRSRASGVDLSIHAHVDEGHPVVVHIGARDFRGGGAKGDREGQRARREARRAAPQAPPANVSARVASAIRAAREAAGLTQAAAAEAHGVSQPAWAQWENGARGVSLEQLEAIACTLGAELVVDLRPAKRRAR